MPITNLKDAHSNALGAEITELFGLITAATYELLVKIHERGQGESKGRQFAWRAAEDQRGFLQRRDQLFEGSGNHSCCNTGK